MTGKQLKNSILQWAIQGKLVPQDPNDEPASVLLERIRSEKKRLVKEGKIKKDKNESIIFRGDDNSYYEKFPDGDIRGIDDEIPYLLPSGWEWARLGCLVFNHGQITPNQPFSYIDIGSINNVDLCLNEVDNIIQANDAPSRARRLVEFGDILYSTVRPYLHNMCIVDREFSAKPIASTGLAVMACCSGLLNRYLFFYLQSPQFDLYANDGDNAKGVAYPAINDEKLYRALIPVPPTKEQYRIAEVIDSIFPALKRYNSSQSKKDELNRSIKPKLMKSILQEAIQGKLVQQDPNEEPASVLLEHIHCEKQKLLKEGKLKKNDIVDSIIYKGDDNKYYEKVGGIEQERSINIPFEIPSSWCWVRLSQVVQFNPKNLAPNETEAAFIPMEKIIASFHSHFTYEKRKWGEINTAFTHFADGDVALAKITPCFQNRKSIILCGLPNGIGAGTTELKVLRPYGDTINRDYLLLFLKSPYVIEEATFKGTANQQRILSGYLENKFFPLPPINEQGRIADRIRMIFSNL